MGRSRLLTSVLLVVGGLTTGADPRAQEQKPTLEGYPAQGAPAVVTLLSPGAAPRVKLRYAIPANQRARMNMTMSMSMAMGMAGMALPAVELPTMKMAIDLGVTSVTPSGDTTYALAYAAMTAEAGAGMDRGVVAAIQNAASGITAVKGTATVTARGITRSVSLNLDQVTDPQLRQTLSAMTNSVENLSTPLPEDAVGVGARWEVRQSLSTNAMYTFQKSEFEVVAIDGAAVSLKVTTEQTAPPQAVSNPAMPPDADIRLEKLTGSGTGSLVIRFDSLVPTSEMQSTTSTVMVANLGGQTQQITVDVALKLTMSPGTIGGFVALPRSLDIAPSETPKSDVLR